jgi:signal transduction histidine kinase
VQKTWQSAIERASHAGGTVESLEYVTCKDGRKLPLLIGGQIVENGLIATFTDISPLKAAESAIKGPRKKPMQPARQRAALANMSHEIRTPMNAILGYAHLLGKTSLQPEQTIVSRRSRRQASTCCPDQRHPRYSEDRSRETGSGKPISAWRRHRPRPFTDRRKRHGQGFDD